MPYPDPRVPPDPSFAPRVPPDPSFAPRSYTAEQPSLHAREDSSTPSDTADKASGKHAPSKTDTITLAVVCAVIPTVLLLLLLLWFKRRAKRRRARAMSVAHRKWDPAPETAPPATRSWVDVDVEMAMGRPGDEDRGMHQLQADVGRGTVTYEMTKDDAWMGGRDVTSLTRKPYSANMLPAPPPPAIVGTESRHGSYYAHPAGVGHAAILQQPSCHPLLRGQIPTHH